MFIAIAGMSVSVATSGTPWNCPRGTVAVASEVHCGYEFASCQGHSLVNDVGLSYRGELRGVVPCERGVATFPLTTGLFLLPIPATGHDAASSRVACVLT